MWLFKKKEQPEYVLVRDYKGKYHICVDFYKTDTTHEYPETYHIIEKSEDKSLITGLFVSLSQQAELAEEIKKHITDSMPKEYVDKIKVGDGIFINEPLVKSTIPTAEDIKNMIEDPDTIYAVEGHFPNLVISKYKKELEDSFNYCLRMESGNLALLPKDICFHKKADAIEYQNKIIQKEVDNINKDKILKSVV